MVAVKTPSLQETYKAICGFLQTNAKLTVIVANHIAAKHSIHSLPAFHTTDAVTEQDKLVTYGEIARALAKKDYGSLKGQVANGQAAESAPPAPAAEPPNMPRADLVPSAEAKPRVTIADNPPPGGWTESDRVTDPLAEKKKAAKAALKTLDGFIGLRQLAAIQDLMKGEEREWFYDKLVELAGIVEKMPATGETEKVADPIVYLHYFAGGQANAYVTEKDKGDKDDAKNGVEPQSQAFGLVDLFADGGEIGYISLPEMFKSNAEMDLHWTPKPLSEVRKKHAPAEEPEPVTPPPAPPPPPMPAFKPADLTKRRDAVIPLPSEIADPAPAATSHLDAVAERHAKMNTHLDQSGIGRTAPDLLSVHAEVIALKAGQFAALAHKQVIHDLLFNVPTGIVSADNVSAERALRSAIAGFTGTLVKHDVSEAMLVCADIMEDVNAHDVAAALRRMARGE